MRIGPSHPDRAARARARTSCARADDARHHHRRRRGDRDGRDRRRARARRSQQQIASLGTNLLIVLSGATTLGRRCGRRRLVSRRSPRTTRRDRSARCPARRTTSAPSVRGARAGRLRQRELGDGRSHGVTAGLPRDPRLAGRRRARFFTDARRRRRRQGRRARPDRRDEPVRRHAIRSARRCACSNVPFHGRRRARRARARRRRARTRTTSCSSRLDGRRRSCSAGSKSSARSILVSVAGRRATTLDGAATRSRRCCAQRHHIGPGEDDDFTVRNLTEIARGAQEATRAHDARCSPRSRRCRCSSAASGS